jgi:DNA-directed RNA polymerase specialized sigma24 family protein
MTKAGNGRDVREDVAGAREGPGKATIGDAAVRRELLECHRDLLRFFGDRLADVHYAEEALQTFIAKALSPTLAMREAFSARSWLCGLLATTLADHRRQVGAAPETGRPTAQPDIAADAVIAACLYRLLPTLRPGHSQLIWRIDLLGEPCDRAAVALGRSLRSVEGSLGRSRQDLWARLEAMGRVCPEHGLPDCRCVAGERIRLMRVGLRSRESPR